MLTPLQALLHAFDGHCTDDILAALQQGADPCERVNGKLPIYWLLEEYTRSDRLPECLQLLIERGASMPDATVLPVLLDDAASIRAMLQADPDLIHHRTTLVSSFSSLIDATLLHVAAEYGNQNSARTLIEAGADVNATSGMDEFGLNGHSPLFHTVNSNRNRSLPIMRMLIDAGASVTMKLKGLRWGTGYPWETIFFDITPISFAQMGLLPQVHRDEIETYSNVSALLEATGERVPPLTNVPNRYLKNNRKAH